MIHPCLHLVCRLTALLCLGPSLAAAAFPALYLKNVCDDALHAPTNITHAGDGSGRLFICDQPGKIYVFEGGMLRPTPFLDLSAASGGPVIAVGTGYTERGLLGMCFHPDYENPAAAGYRRFFVNYTGVSTTATPNPSTPQNCVTVVAEYLVSASDPNLADPTSQRILLTYGQPQSNHNGGQLAFGPDGFLYIGSGDGGGANDNPEGHTGGSGVNSPGRITGNLGNAQDTTKLLGKILRIDPLGTNGPGGQYGIPPDNPFASSIGAQRKEIYAFGMRNPWRFSFDAPAGGPTRLFCADVGQGDVEEIDLITLGGNYGWRMKEGSIDFDSTAPSGGGTLIPPVAEYAHPNATLPGTASMPKYGTSITGGMVYRGSAIPAMQGKFLFGDYAANGIGGGGGILLGLEETTPGVFSLSQVTPMNPLPASARIYTFGVDESGEMFLAAKTTSGVLTLDGGKPAGTIYKILPVQTVNTTVDSSLDNTIFSEDATNGTFTSDARGYLYAGNTGPQYQPFLRRALVAFDLAPAVPAGALIQSAQVKLNLNKVGPSAVGTTLALHRLNETWGEGTSVNPSGGTGAPATTNDATWTRRFYNTTSWTTAGGSFQSAASATATAAFGQVITWGSTSSLVSDVQGWVNNPATNAGWILRGDEVTEGTACRFDSRQMGATAPALQIAYQVPPPPTHFEMWLATNFPNNHVGQWVDPEGDPDGDSVPNQIEYAYGLAATAYDYETNFTTAVTPAAGGGTEFTITFRRDPNATDLTYRLQVDDNLAGWTTIAQSTGGGGAAGQNGGTVVSDDDISGQFPFRLVTVRITLPAGTNAQFVRLSVDRQP